MMATYPVLEGDAVVAALELGGFEAVWRRGNHVRLASEAGRVVTAPIFPTEAICPGLLRKILRDAKLDVAAFEGLAGAVLPAAIPEPPGKS
jgi:predicted RNA binding protein YcfA (HicA-like mRNA interferase family)